MANSFYLMIGIQSPLLIFTLNTQQDIIMKLIQTAISIAMIATTSHAMANVTTTVTPAETVEMAKTQTQNSVNAVKSKVATVNSNVVAKDKMIHSSKDKVVATKANLQTSIKAVEKKSVVAQQDALATKDQTVKATQEKVVAQAQNMTETKVKAEQAVETKVEDIKETVEAQKQTVQAIPTQVQETVETQIEEKTTVAPKTEKKGFLNWFKKSAA